MIGPFTGPWECFSNFSPHAVRHAFAPGETRVFCQTLEHGYQAAKTLNPQERAMILAAPTPGNAKRLGRKAVLRPDWETIKLQVMETLVFEKFYQNPGCRAALLASGQEKLVEVNTWNDTYWGVCRGCGENHLGRILMKVRTALQVTSPSVLRA